MQLDGAYHVNLHDHVKVDQEIFANGDATDGCPFSKRPCFLLCQSLSFLGNEVRSSISFFALFFFVLDCLFTGLRGNFLAVLFRSVYRHLKCPKSVMWSLRVRVRPCNFINIAVY